MKKLSLIIPIYNEESHLQRFLQELDQLAVPVEKELIFVDDASTDGSLNVLKSYEFQSSHQIICQPQNRGKGAAIGRGIAAATGDVIGVQDADFEYCMSEIPALIKPIFEGKCDVVFGSRFKSGNYQVHRTFHYMVNKFLTVISNFLSGLYFSDMETCYKFFKADIIQNVKLQSERFGFEPEITAKIARLKIRVEEQPISYFPRNYIEGKKITWRDGLAALWHITYFNVFVDQKKCFLPSLPKEYIPAGRQLL